MPFGEKAVTYVVFDKTVVCGPIDFKCACIVTFSLYYIFNIAYLLKLSTTMEFMQRYIMFNFCNKFINVNS